MANYAATVGDTIYTGATAVTEDLSRVSGFIAGCGEAALLVVLNAVKGVPTAPSDVTALIKQAVNSRQVTGGLAASGETSPGNLETLASQYGVTLTSGDYKRQLASYAGVKPVILGVSNATAFGGSNANVHGHYITVVGRTATGNYIVSDPNTPQSKAGRFVQYSPSQIDAAQPFWSAVPNGAVLGGSQTVSTSSIGIGPLQIQLPNWLSSLGTGLGSFSDWLNPVRLFKFFLGLAICATIVGVLLFEGVFRAVDAGTKTVSKVAGKAATIAAIVPK